MMRSLVLAGLALLQLAGAQELPPVSGLPHAVVLRRIPAGDGWDLVVALSSSTKTGWTTKDRVGLLLQNGDRVLPLAIEPGPNDDCSTRVERLTVAELVLSCVGEKWSTYSNQKFVYDVHARKVTSHFSYGPFLAERVLPGPRFVMAAGERRLMVDVDPASGDPRVSGDRVPAAPAESELAFGRFRLTKQKNRYGSEHAVIAGNGKFYPLTQSANQPDLEEMNEEVGPHQLEATRLWFGKTFYNGEGLTGVGGFGYFDTATASFRMFAPPEMAQWSVSAILVEADCVWLGLDHRGEYGNYPGALLRWDRNNETVRHWDVQSVVTGIARGGDAIYLGATDGVAVLRGDRLVSYFVDRQSAVGPYRMAARN
jgi:hypothetical protein